MGDCHARRKNGQPCKARPRNGATVCNVHGGLAPQVKDAAARRILEAAYPAAVKMRELVDNRNPMVALAAAKDILDRNGFKAIERVQQDGRVLIEIELIDKARRIVEHDRSHPAT